MSGINVSYIFQPKFVSPFNDGRVYFVPAVNNQKGVEYNWICVCCSPSYNGVWRYPAENTKNYKKWNNNGKWCYYVPVDDCEFVKELDDITIQPTIEKIASMQQAWAEKARPKKLPKWFVIKELDKIG